MKIGLVLERQRDVASSYRGEVARALRQNCVYFVIPSEAEESLTISVSLNVC